MHIRIQATAAALAVPIALLAAAAPSQAEDLTTNDPAGDVVKIPNENENDVQPSPGTKAVDITRFTTKYGNDRLKLVTKVRDLAQDNYQVRWRVKTQTSDSNFFYDPDSPFRHQQRGCAFQIEADQDTDTITAIVPRTCIGDAAWVRTGSATLRNGEQFRFLDDARRDGAAFPGGVKIGDKHIDYN